MISISAAVHAHGMEKILRKFLLKEKKKKENPHNIELAGHSMPGGADRAVTVYWANNPQTKTDLLYMADRNSSKETITVSCA